MTGGARYSTRSIVPGGRGSPLFVGFCSAKAGPFAERKATVSSSLRCSVSGSVVFGCANSAGEGDPSTNFGAGARQARQNGSSAANSVAQATGPIVLARRYETG